MLNISFLRLCGVLLVTSVAALAGDINSRSAHCDNIEQSYMYFSPSPTQNLPAVVLLHGAGDQPVNMLNAWKSFAAKKKIVLLAPELPRDVKFEQAAPRVFRCVVEDAKGVTSIDPKRVYVFGNSMGGYLAYDAAMFESEYFAAIAVHAMRIADDYAWIVDRARRKTPIAIYIGDHDQFFTQESVRQTRDLLLKFRFPVHYVELRRHDHNYYALSDQINEDAWNFLKEFRLPQ